MPYCAILDYALSCLSSVITIKPKTCHAGIKNTFYLLCFHVMRNLLRKKGVNCNVQSKLVGIGKEMQTPLCNTHSRMHTHGILSV